jgi:hypothetical protein
VREAYERRIIPSPGGSSEREAWESPLKVKGARHVADISREDILCPLPGTCMDNAAR